MDEMFETLEKFIVAEINKKTTLKLSALIVFNNFLSVVILELFHKILIFLD
jgi:hypothetical protein